MRKCNQDGPKWSSLTSKWWISYWQKLTKKAIRNSLNLSNDIIWVPNSEINMDKRKEVWGVWSFGPVEGNIEAATESRLLWQPALSLMCTEARFSWEVHLVEPRLGYTWGENCQLRQNSEHDCKSRVCSWTTNTHLVCKNPGDVHPRVLCADPHPDLLEITAELLLWLGGV